MDRTSFFSTDLYTKEEKRSLLYYQGAGSRIQLEQSEKNLEKFYQIENSYETINMLLFSGIGNEKSRLWKESRSIEPEILDFMPELLKVYRNLYSAICKYTYLSSHENLTNTVSAGKRAVTYRDDRWNTYLSMKEGVNPSFLSTTKNVHDFEDGNNIFQKKDGLVLLECEFSESMEYLDMNAVLGKDSIYPEETEILFPPFLYCGMERLEMTENEKKLQDVFGEPPRGKFRVTLKGSTIEARNPEELQDGLEDLYQKIIDPDAIENAKNVWSKFSQKKVPEKQAVLKYIQWKQYLRLYLRDLFSGIKWKVHHTERKEQFYQYLLREIDVSNSYREKYEKQLRFFHIGGIILGGCSALVIAIAMLLSAENMVLGCKILGVVFAVVCIVFLRICKSLSVEEKLCQRTITYLRLDELRMDFEFEKDWSEEKVEEYIERLKQIIRDDNQLCVQYTNNVVHDLNQLRAKMTEKVE